MLCPRDLFDALDAEAQGGRHSLVDGLRRLVERGQVRAPIKWEKNFSKVLNN